MFNARRIVIAALFVSHALVSWGAQELSSLADAAKQHDVMVMTVADYEPATFDMLVATSDLILVGTITGGSTFLLHDHVLTDYAVSVDRVIRRTQPPARTTGDVVVVRRYGGTMAVEGHRVTGQENDFPPFTIGGRYVLFLTPGDAGPYYWVNDGPQGAFTVTNGLVRQVWEGGSWNQERGVVTLDAFLQEIQKTATARPQPPIR